MAYQTLGEVQLFFDNLLVPGVKKSGKVGKTTLTQGTEEYRRSLNLEDAVCRTGFRMEIAAMKERFLHPILGMPF